MVSLESPPRGDYNEYTQYTIFNMKQKKKNLNYPKSVATRVVSKRLKNEFETAKVNEPSVFEPSVFEPLKFYCIYRWGGSSSMYLWQVNKPLPKLVQQVCVSNFTFSVLLNPKCLKQKCDEKILTLDLRN